MTLLGGNRAEACCQLLECLDEDEGQTGIKLTRTMVYEALVITGMVRNLDPDSKPRAPRSFDERKEAGKRRASSSGKTLRKRQSSDDAVTEWPCPPPSSSSGAAAAMPASKLMPPPEARPRPKAPSISAPSSAPKPRPPSAPKPPSTRKPPSTPKPPSAQGPTGCKGRPPSAPKPPKAPKFPISSGKSNVSPVGKRCRHSPGADTAGRKRHQGNGEIPEPPASGAEFTASTTPFAAAAGSTFGDEMEDGEVII